MQEETIPISEEEASDSEIVMISHHRQSLQQQTEEQRVDRHMKSQEKLIDNQLKALGLFEEGLSYEQKEELLAVVAASRETAEHEESMRIQAKEWQQKVFQNTSEYDTVVQLNEQSENSPSPGRVEDSMQLLNIDEEDCMTSGISQDVYEPLELDDLPSKDTEDPTSATEQSYETVEVRSKRIGGRRGRGRRGGRGRGQGGPLKVSPQSSLSVDLENSEGEMSQNLQIDHRKQRKELEKFMNDWRPCLSPNVKPLVNKRLCDVEPEVSSESAGDDDVCENLCDSIDQYHISLSEFQRTASSYIPWGQPLTVGRAYATRSSRGRVPESETTDCVLSYQSPGISDSMFLMENSEGDRYMQLQQYDKLFYQGLDSSGMNSTRTVSPFPVVTVLGNTDSTSQLIKTSKLSQESVSPPEDKTVIVKEQTDVDTSGTVATTRRSKRVVSSDSGGSSGTPGTKISVSSTKSTGYFSSETVTRIEDASSDSSVDIETCDSELPVRKDGSKTYSSKQLPVSDNPAGQDCESQGEEVVSRENSPPVKMEADSPNCQSSQSKTDSCTSVKRKRSTAASHSSPKVSASPSKRWKESGIA